MVLEGGYTPAPGDRYDLFDWGTGRTGEFATVTNVAAVIGALP